MPQFDFSTFPSQLLWLLFSFLPLYLSMEFVFVPKIKSIWAKRFKIASDNKEKEKLILANSNELKALYDSEIARARERSSNMIVEMRKDLFQRKQQAMADIKARIEYMTSEHEKKIHDVILQSKVLILRMIKELIVVYCNKLNVNVEESSLDTKIHGLLCFETGVQDE